MSNQIEKQILDATNLKENVVNDINEDTQLLEQLNSGYHKSIEYPQLHQSNKEHLDWGRIDFKAKKLKAMRGRLNVAQFNSLTGTERITNVSKDAIWIATQDDLDEQGFSTFGKIFYRTIRNSISLRPVASTDTILHLNKDPVVNAEMMAALYVWANDQILKQFENQPIRTLADSLLFLRGITENGLVFPTVEFNADEITEMLKDTNVDLDYFNIDLLAQAGKMEKVQIDFTKAKQFMLSEFPEYQDELNRYSNLHYNYLIGAQLGRSFRNKIIHFPKTLLKTKNSAENAELELGSENIQGFNLEEYTPNSDGEIHLIQELNMLSSMNIRFTGLGGDNLVFRDSEQISLRNKNLHQAERTGYDWFNETVNPDENEVADVVIDKIAADKLAETFDIGGFQWGASVNGIQERAEWLKLISESLTDLAYALDIDVKSVSLPLNEEKGLGIAIGSHGVRGTLAHYRPDNHFLHLNRSRSTGTMAHEWFHAYDNYLFNKAIQGDIFPEKVIVNSLNKGGDSYFAALSEFIKLPDNDKSTHIQQVKDFDPALYALAENVWLKKNVMVQNNEDGQEFVYNFNNYDNREDLFNKVDKYIEQSIDDYRSFVNNLDLITVYCSFEKINDMTFEQAEQNMLETPRLKNKVMNLNNAINQMVGIDSPYFNPLVKFNLETKKSEPTLQKMTDEDYKQGLCKAIAEHMQIYRQTFLNKESLTQIKEDISNILEQSEEQIFKDFSKKVDLSTKIGLAVYANNNEGIVNTEKVRQTLMHDNEVKQGFNESVKDGYMDITKQVMTRLGGSMEKPNAYIGNALVKFMSNEHRALQIDVQDLLTNRITQNIHQNILEQNLSFSLGQRFSNILSQSLSADGLKISALSFSPKAYYSKPEEIFARIGETTVFKALNELSFQNLFLSNTGERIQKQVFLGTPTVYPIGGEGNKLVEHMKNSFQNHFPAFNLSLENRNIVENEYSNAIVIKNDNPEEPEVIHENTIEPENKNENKQRKMKL